MNLMTPGPTKVRENVRIARSEVTGNPDLEASFYDFYKETCQIVSKLMHTDNETFILSGEGILGLEAAVASLTEVNDKVLVLDNGVFGKGFADFVSMYGGKPTLYTTDYKKTIDVDALHEYLKENHDFKYATLVHCDTPSGMLNDISKICPLLKSYGIMTVVDSVSAMFGEYVDVDASGIDILCGGSQKALSCPIGLTMVTVSDDAKEVINNRQTPVAGFYCNLKNFFSYYEEQWFPYTMPESDIKGLRVALDNVVNEGAAIYERHARLARATRKALIEAGLKLHTENGFSNTVTAFLIPDGITSDQILEKMRDDHGIMLAGSFDVMAGSVIRIGHMGENANDEDMISVMGALDQVFDDLGLHLSKKLLSIFKDEI